MEAHRKVRGGEIAIRNPETQGTMVVPVKSYENYWQGRGWVPVGQSSLAETIASDGYDSAAAAVEDLGEDEVGSDILDKAVAEGYVKKSTKKKTSGS